MQRMVKWMSGSSSECGLGGKKSKCTWSLLLHATDMPSCYIILFFMCLCLLYGLFKMWQTVAQDLKETLRWIAWNEMAFLIFFILQFTWCLMKKNQEAERFNVPTHVSLSSINANNDSLCLHGHWFMCYSHNRYVSCMYFPFYLLKIVNHNWASHFA